MLVIKDLLIVHHYTLKVEHRKVENILSKKHKTNKKNRSPACWENQWTVMFLCRYKSIITWILGCKSGTIWYNFDSFANKRVVPSLISKVKHTWKFRYVSKKRELNCLLIPSRIFSFGPLPPSRLVTINTFTQLHSNVLFNVNDQKQAYYEWST